MAGLEDKIKAILEGSTEVELTAEEITQIQEEAKIVQDKLDEHVTEVTEEKKDEVADVKETFSIEDHVKALGEGVEGLTEESLKKVAVIFEAAVLDGIKNKEAALQEQFDTALAEAVEKKTGELVEHIDEYLDSIVESWLEENRLNLESGIKSDMFESFVDGMKKLFVENYVDVPEDKLNVIEEQADEIKKLADEVAALKEEKLAVEKAKVVLESKAIIDEVCSDLAETEIEKIRSLAEGIEFDSVESFKEKIETLKESYFPKSSNKQEESSVSVPGSINESVAKYAQYLG